MTPLECKAARQKMKYRIRERLERKGTSMSGVAEDLGVNLDLVRGTIYGKRNNRRVLLALRDKYGVPEKYLFIPKSKGEDALNTPAKIMVDNGSAYAASR